MAPTNPTIRLAVVHTPKSSGLLDVLLPEFETEQGYDVVVDEREDVYSVARNGGADLVISHLGHKELQAFMQDGLGLWPHAVFSNQSSLIGPSSDPANVRGLTDIVEAYRRIAATQSPFVINNAATELYLTKNLWVAAGFPNGSGWLMQSGLRDQAAVDEAARVGGYTVWGVVPFLLLQQSGGDPSLEALVVNDPMLQRMMVTVIPNPSQIAGTNFEGARQLEAYLVRPRAQAAVRAFRFPGFDAQIWWPAGRNNSGEYLTEIANPNF